MATIWEEETRRAKLYRSQWDARIAFRANQLRALSGSPEAFNELWDALLPIYSPFNYVDGEEDVEFVTPYDVSDDGSISSSSVRLRGTSHAGDGMQRRSG
jgi:hypothetical protein